MDLWVTFIGTAASVPTASRGTSATLVVRGGSRVLVDCGEGTQRQFLRSGLGLLDLDAILLTHLHGDHYLGLPGLLKTYALRGSHGAADHRRPAGACRVARRAPGRRRAPAVPARRPGGTTRPGAGTRRCVLGRVSDAPLGALARICA